VLSIAFTYRSDAEEVGYLLEHEGYRIISLSDYPDIGWLLKVQDAEILDYWELELLVGEYNGEILRPAVFRRNPEQVKVFHLSPHANIQKFRGHYSPKMKAKGIFVSQSWKSLLHDWAGTLSNKRFGGRGLRTIIKRQKRLERELDRHSEDSEEYQEIDARLRRSYRGSDLGNWKNLTIYQLLVPKEVFQVCQERMDQLAQAAFNRAGMGAIGAWGWGVETFIFEEFLDQVTIDGRETISVKDLIKMHHRRSNLVWQQEKNIHQKLEEYRTEINQLIEKFGRAPLLDRAFRYANNPEIWPKVENNQRHFRLLDQLLEPYRRQLS